MGFHHQVTFKLILYLEELFLQHPCLTACEISGLSDVQGLEIVSDPKSPIVFLKLKKSTGSLKGDLQVLEDIAERVSGLNS